MRSFLLLLLSLSVAIGVIYLGIERLQQQALDNQVFNDTMSSLRSLQVKDGSFQKTVVESRFGAQADLTKLYDIHYALSEEFDNLRFEALFEEIEADSGLGSATKAFEDKFIPREDALESFIAAITDEREINAVAQAESALNEYKALQSLDTVIELDNMIAAYARYHEGTIRDANLTTQIFAGVGALLALLVAFMGYSLWRSNRDLELQVEDRTSEIAAAYDDLKSSQQRLVQSEKLASLGQLVAGIAHEINTPLGYVSGNSESLLLNQEELSELVNSVGDIDNIVKDSPRNAKAITTKLKETLRVFRETGGTELIDENRQLLKDGIYGLKEISKLVSGLKDFARQDKSQKEAYDLNQCVRNALLIARNQIVGNAVNVQTNLTDLPLIKCHPSKLNQVFLNLITNACHAMRDGGGTLSIDSQVIGDKIQVQLIDSGMGMDAQTADRIFDPFFTTKDVGSGTGLGLSIAFNIIKAHAGLIYVESKVGEGAKFTIELPLELNDVGDSPENIPEHAGIDAYVLPTA